MPAPVAPRALRPPKPAADPVPVPALVMENGLGGFTPDGREYVVVLEGDRETPLPWSNVMANPEFGTMASSSGAAFTWAGNSRENRLTPFANDPITDPTGEAIYLRDEGSGEVWAATPGPLPRRADSGRWVIRHTAGVTRYQHADRRPPAGAGDRRGCRRPGQAGPVDADQHLHRGAPAERVRVRRVVPRAAAGGRTAVSSSPAWTVKPGRCWRATCTTRSSATTSRSGTPPHRPAPTRATAPSSSGATAPQPVRRRSCGIGWRADPARGSTRARRCR